ncbi:hypothetical protein ACQR3Z_32425 [Nocardia fluminea]
MVPDDAEHRSLSEVLDPKTSVSLPIPIPNTPRLPFSLLEPEVFERVVAEVVSTLRDHHSVQFYGRRGQKQYGLDIVESETATSRVLYQVKRFDTLTKAKLRKTVTEYTGGVRKKRGPKRSRRFEPRLFVVVTSAETENDTALVDELDSLRREYSGDIDLELWGAEELSRKMRDLGRLVNVVFGEAWAREFSGFIPGAEPTSTPNKYGFVDDPIEALNLTSMRTQADSVDESDPARAASIYGAITEALRTAGFVGHALSMLRRQARALGRAGRNDDAFALAFDVSVAQLLKGDADEAQRLLSTVEEFDLSDLQRSQLVVAATTLDARLDESRLRAAVEALAAANTDGASSTGQLCCLLLERAVASGLYDHNPARIDGTTIDPATATALETLRSLAAASTCHDRLARTRLRCAVADASSTLLASEAETGKAFDSLVTEAKRGRLGDAQGLVYSRAAYAYAARGYIERGEILWEQAAMACIEDGYYGDAWAALRSIQWLMSGAGNLFSRPLAEYLRALPNRRSIMESVTDASLNALEAASQGRLHQADGEVRRWGIQSRILGDAASERRALELLGDIQAEAQHFDWAVDSYIRAGQDRKAASAARKVDGYIDVRHWLRARNRRVQNAAIAVVAVHVRRYDDSDIENIAGLLLEVAGGIWAASPVVQPQPEFAAVEALAKFGIRIPAALVDQILTLAVPPATRHNSFDAPFAQLLIETYNAVGPRREGIAQALRPFLAGTSDPDSIQWRMLLGLPETARTDLTPVVAGLAGTGNLAAEQTLHSWGFPASKNLQFRARVHCARVLRWPVGANGTGYAITSLEDDAVDAVKTLAAVPDPVQFETEPFISDRTAPRSVPSIIQIRITEADAESDTDEEAQPEAGTDLSPIAATAAGPVNELIAAVAEKLVCLAADTTAPRAVRVRSIRAIQKIIEHIEPAQAGSIAVSIDAARRQPSDAMADAIEHSDALAAFNVNLDGAGMNAAGVRCVASAYRRSRSDIAATTSNQPLVRRIAASSGEILAHGDDGERYLAAQALVDLIVSTDLSPDYLFALVNHRDHMIRSIAVPHWALTPEEATRFANDPSPNVRARIAARATELPADVRDTLANDPDLGVRHTLEQALLVPSPRNVG